MRTKVKYRGIVIALAWPATYCKQPGSWYDAITARLGANRYNYYKAGHAAVVLVDVENKANHYFDFGRYHAPFKFGRARSGETDHDLRMKTAPEISADGNALMNFHEILEELQQNPACHGEGKLYASYAQVNFDTSYKEALKIQQTGPVPYGPFVRKGSNCSRFVNTVILAGKPGLRHRLRLKYFVPLTPTPMNNVNSLLYKRMVPVMREAIPFKPFRWLTGEEKQSTIPAPGRHIAIPEKAQWLSGEGAGSWFVLEVLKGQLLVTRYGPDGKVECKGFFDSNDESDAKVIKGLVASGDYTVDHLSNCKQVTLRNSLGEVFYFVRTARHLQSQ